MTTFYTLFGAGLFWLLVTWNALGLFLYALNLKGMHRHHLAHLIMFFRNGKNRTIAIALSDPEYLKALAKATNQYPRFWKNLWQRRILDVKAYLEGRKYK